MKPVLFLRILLWLLALGLLAYAAIVLLVCHWEVTNPAPDGYDSIIVLGCQVKPDGAPSVQLTSRLDTALSYYQLSPCKIAVTGAQGDNEPAPEAQVMQSYLLEMGVKAEDILTDSESFDTRENIENAHALLSAHGCTKPLIVTSDYHVRRAVSIAADAGITAQGAGAPCRSEFVFWAKNHGREALAWVKYWLVKYLKLPL